MTTDSVWLVEKRIFGRFSMVSQYPCPTKHLAELEAERKKRASGGEYRVVEYRRVKEGEEMPYEDEDGLVECGHGDETFCEECGGCLDCGNCYCDDDGYDFDE